MTRNETVELLRDMLLCAQYEEGVAGRARLAALEAYEDAYLED